MSTPKPTTAAAGDYRLRVKDFGPIIEADVVFRPLTVLVGPSNSGKSYLAGLLYAMQRNSAWAGIQQERIGAHVVWPNGPVFEFSDSLKRDLRSWLTAADGSPDVPAPLREALQRGSEGQLAQALEHELRRCFGVPDLSELRRWASTAETEIEWRAVPSTVGASSVAFGLSGNSVAAAISDPASVSASDYGLWRRAVGGKGKSDLAVDLLVDEVVMTLFDKGFSSTIHRAHYLPGDRAGLLRHREAVMTNLIRNASNVTPQPVVRSGPTLPGIAADFLEQVTSIRPKGPRGDYPAQGAEVEKRVLEGTIEVRFNPFGYPEFVYAADTSGSQELPLPRASSMVSGLASLVLYLYWRVQSGNVLIIEEPEVHVHPAKQTELARQLVRMVRAGIRVVVTTHSEWLLEQLGNLTQLSDLPADRRKGIEEPELALAPKEVGVWLFRERPEQGGATVEEVPLEPESGLFPTGYDEIGRDLYNQSAVIFNRREALKE